MKINFKNTSALVATLVLSVVAIFSGALMYNLRGTLISPNAPEKSQASNDNVFVACEENIIKLSTASPSPSSSASSSPSSSPSTSASPTASASSNPSSSPTATPSNSSSATPSSQASSTPTSTATVRPSSTSNPSSASTSKPTATPATLPVAGFSAPTIIGMVVAGVLLLGALLLAI